MITVLDLGAPAPEDLVTFGNFPNPWIAWNPFLAGQIQNLHGN
jgi:hypothetical protein